MKKLLLTKCGYLCIGILCMLSAGCDLGKSLNNSLAKARPSVDTLTRDAGRQVMGGLSDSAYLLTQRLIQGLKGSMDTLDPDIKKIYRVLDSIGSLSSDQLVKLGNSLDSQIVRIQGRIEVKKIQQMLVGTLEKMTGTLNKQTKNLLSNMIQAALDSLNSSGGRQKLGSITTTLLNDSAKARVQAFVSAAVSPVIDTLSARIDASLHRDVPFVQRQATLLLWSLGLLAAGIIILVWYQRRRYARLTQILTYHIDKIPVQGAYDDLTKQIQKQAQQENLETLLRKTLEKQGINQ